MTRIFQAGLVIEAFLNLVGCAAFMLSPSWCLSFVITSAAPNKPNTVPASTAVLWQVYGGLVLALTVPILLVIPESHAVFEKRELIFKTLVAGEIILIGVLGWHGLGLSGHDEEGGFSRVGLLISAAFLLPALTWHSFTVWVRPDLMRSERDERRVKIDRKRS